MVVYQRKEEARTTDGDTFFLGGVSLNTFFPVSFSTHYDEFLFVFVIKDPHTVKKKKKEQQILFNVKVLCSTFFLSTTKKKSKKKRKN